MRVSLSGQWQFRLDHETTWRPIHVPGCWEDLGVAKNHPGPGWYRTKLNVPERAHGKRLWMHFESVSYHAVILINDRVVGEHLGLWDAFRLEVTGALTPGETAELLVRVEKPASLVRGPASDAVPGRYPLKETLAGFLPYVWGHIFGGIWQAVYLEATDGAVFDAVSVRGDALGTVRAEANLSDAAELQLTIRDAAGAITHSETARGKDLVLMGALAKPALWSPANPTLYHATLAITGGETRTLSFGFRTLAVDSTDVLLNGKAIYPRFALSWGWYPESLYSNPGRERVREDLLKLKALGYNGVKLCLWVPPHYYFELADELGMLLWLELPMWLPKPTPFWHQQTPLEYRRVVQQVRYHPAIIMYSLGCELNREVSADILEALYEDVKGLVGDALLRDNSGSGEAYGGLLNEYADYYDYHFYSDIQFFRPLIDYFTPRWRPEQPWVFGEFCDLDTFRNLQKVIDANEGEKPWWLQTDDNLNPQGARWQFDIVEQEERLKANGFWARGDELELISHKQALLHRKFTLELVRTYREISGYVITGERDTPISTAGMWDDLGAFKFPPDAFKAFNQDLVLALGWGKRRAWVAGGDRAAHWDTFSYPAGATVRAHLILSHYGQARGKAKVGWRVTRADGSLVADGVVVSQEDFKPGIVREAGIAEFVMPQVSTPVQITLTAVIELAGERSENSWPLWVFPSDPWDGVAPIRLDDPTRRLRGLEVLAAITSQEESVVVATAWTSALEAHVRKGGRTILLTGYGDAGPFPSVATPFWREAVKVIEAHPAWLDFPHNGWTDLQFFGVAPDHALDTAALVDVKAILRRVDARTMAVLDYAVELPLEQGRLIVSTLRFEGGLGEQPMGIQRNTAGAYLLRCWLTYLQGL